VEAHLDMLVKAQRAIDVIDRMTHERDGIDGDEADSHLTERIIGSSVRDGAILP
jgi:hypothetical protein